MSSLHLNPTLAGSDHENGKTNAVTETIRYGEHQQQDGIEEREYEEAMARLERKLVRKIDLRLCSIAGILCSLNLLDSGIISVSNIVFRLLRSRSADSSE
jgi:hypothetical protein